MMKFAFLLSTTSLVAGMTVERHESFEYTPMFNCPNNRPFGDIGKQFDDLILEYFSTNFGKGGLDYLEKFTNKNLADDSTESQLCTWAATLQEGSPILTKLKKEMRAIVSGELGLSRPDISKPRYRIHRFLGMISGGSQGTFGANLLPSGDRIAYADSFEKGDRSLMKSKMQDLFDLLQSKTPKPEIITASLALIGTLSPIGLDEKTEHVFDLILEALSLECVARECLVALRLLNNGASVGPKQIQEAYKIILLWYGNLPEWYEEIKKIREVCPNEVALIRLARDIIDEMGRVILHESGYASQFEKCDANSCCATVEFSTAKPFQILEKLACMAKDNREASRCSKLSESVPSVRSWVDSRKSQRSI